jgi:acetylornithine/succinyldiaminopimelate/putrescine aminotransferase
MSVSGNELKKQAFRPLLPDVQFLQLNKEEDLLRITEKTAAVILETIQGDAGVRRPNVTFMKALRQRCDEVGAMLILDEIQCGMGRTGKMFAFEHFDITPDILTLGKALGGGMPIGALVSSQQKLMEFTHAPMLGHITTFGGHPVICAAAAAAVQVLKTEINWQEIEDKAARFELRFKHHPELMEIRRVGMMFAFDMISAERVEKVVARCMEKGLLTFWFLSHPYSFRLSPPLNITEHELNLAADLIISAIADTQ